MIFYVLDKGIYNYSWLEVTQKVGFKSLKNSFPAGYKGKKPQDFTTWSGDFFVINHLMTSPREAQPSDNNKVST